MWLAVQHQFNAASLSIYSFCKLSEAQYNLLRQLLSFEYGESAKRYIPSSGTDMHYTCRSAMHQWCRVLMGLAADS